MFGFWFPFILTLIRPPALSNQLWYLLFGPLTLLEWLQPGCVRKRSSSSLKLWAGCLIPQRYIPRKSCMVPDSTFPRPCIFLTTVPRDPGLLGVGLFSSVTLMQGWDPSLNWASDNPFTRTLLRQVRGDTYNTTLQKTEITYWFFSFFGSFSLMPSTQSTCWPIPQGPPLSSPLLLLRLSALDNTRTPSPSPQSCIQVTWMLSKQNGLLLNGIHLCEKTAKDINCKVLYSVVWVAFVCKELFWEARPGSREEGGRKVRLGQNS